MLSIDPTSVLRNRALAAGLPAERVEAASACDNPRTALVKLNVRGGVEADGLSAREVHAASTPPPLSDDTHIKISGLGVFVFVYGADESDSESFRESLAPAGLRGASTALTCDLQAMWLREELGKAGAGSADEEAWLRWCTRTVRRRRLRWPRWRGGADARLCCMVAFSAADEADWRADSRKQPG
jgi:hypothetical protein